VRAAVPGRRQLAGVALAVGATAVVVAADSWRTAALVLIAAGALLATRVRFATLLALALILVVAAVVAAGGSVRGDHRPAKAHGASLPIAWDDRPYLDR
jgi:hypothetical protein